MTCVQGAERGLDAARIADLFLPIHSCSHSETGSPVVADSPQSPRPPKIWNSFRTITLRNILIGFESAWEARQ